VLNGSPLFTGGAGSGESEIRRYALENDLVEAIIALPTDMFYNTGISTYVWVVSNRKPAPRKGKVQLIDASSFWRKMRKSLGSKRKEMSPEQIDDVTRLFGFFVEAQLAMQFDAEGTSSDGLSPYGRRKMSPSITKAPISVVNPYWSSAR
jgi:type I restriction enzyme M protein